MRLSDFLFLIIVNCQTLPFKANDYDIPRPYNKPCYLQLLQTNIQTMEVIAIQKSALDGMKNELKELLELTEIAVSKYTPIFKKEKWLDNQEVCLMMNITKRTLQTYKNKGLLPYSKLNRKNYYKLSDVKALLEAGQPYNTTDNGFTDE